MNISFNSICNYSVSFFKENFFSTLRQKKILIIVSIALGSLAACYAIYRSMKSLNHRYCHLIRNDHEPNWIGYFDKTKETATQKKENSLNELSNKETEKNEQVQEDSDPVVPQKTDFNEESQVENQESSIINEIIQNEQEPAQSDLILPQEELKKVPEIEKNGQELAQEVDEEKRIEVRSFDSLLNDVDLERHVKENTDSFFDHAFKHLNEQRLSKDQFKILQNLYFTCASDERLKSFIDYCSSDDGIKNSHSHLFLISLEDSHLPRLLNLKLDLDKFLKIFNYVENNVYVVNEKRLSACVFKLIVALYQQQREHAIWEKIEMGWIQIPALKPFVIAAKISEDLKKAEINYLEDSIGSRLIRINPFSDHALLEHLKCILQILLPQLKLTEEDKQRILMCAIFEYNKKTIQDWKKNCATARLVVVETKDQILISEYLKKFLALNHKEKDPSLDLAYIVDSIEVKEQALALIQAVQSLSDELQMQHFGAIRNRILLLKDGPQEEFYEQRLGVPYQDWAKAFEECGLNLDNYKSLNDEEFKKGWRSNFLF